MRVPTLTADTFRSQPFWIGSQQQAKPYSTELLRTFYGVVTELLGSCYGDATELLRKCYGIATELLRNCYEVAMELLRNCYGLAMELLRNCYGHVDNPRRVWCRYEKLGKYSFNNNILKLYNFWTMNSVWQFIEIIINVFK